MSIWVGSGGGGGGIPEAPIDGKQYGRQNAAWTEIVGGGGAMATFDGQLDFGNQSNVAYATIVDPTMTATKVIQPFFTSSLDEVALLGMNIQESSRTVGVGFTVIGATLNGAHGLYNFRCIVSGT